MRAPGGSLAILIALVNGVASSAPASDRGRGGVRAPGAWPDAACAAAERLVYWGVDAARVQAGAVVRRLGPGPRGRSGSGWPAALRPGRAGPRYCFVFSPRVAEGGVQDGATREVTVYGEGRPVPVLGDVDNYTPTPVTCADYDFDGYLDLAVVAQNTTAPEYNYYLFDPRRGRFRFWRDDSLLTPVRGRLLDAVRPTGGGEGTAVRCAWRAGRHVVVGRWHTPPGPGCL